ncbi:MAG: type II toxin-antitoxin system VapC family toxin [Nitrososphaerales archaeon]|jgi:predicted nucleic acid-binding protein
MKVFDSFAWIEYLKGSDRGAAVKSYVDGGEPLYTPSICLTEVKSRYLRDQRDPAPSLNFITERSFIVPLSQEIALQAADERQRRGLHTVDAIVYATGLQRKIAVVTGDQHFRNLPGVEMI